MLIYTCVENFVSLLRDGHRYGVCYIYIYIICHGGLHFFMTIHINLRYSENTYDETCTTFFLRTSTITKESVP